jgi:CO/xanthine dehydrogenase Mo-binding subunit
MYDQIDQKDLACVGHDLPRVDAIEKLTGEATYAGDMIFPGMLHAQVKRSPHARARIVRIDTSKAAALPGVRSIVVGDELDYRIGLYVVDKYILARGEVRHFGEAVAAVAADTLLIAKQAVDLIEVEYEPLPAVLHALEAINPDDPTKPGKAPLVHPNLGEYDYVKSSFTPHPGTNVANYTKFRKGDIEKGFAEADYIVERQYTNPSVQHVPMETHVAVVQWQSGDKITIWTSAQSPFAVRNLFCHSFKIPHKNVRVIIPYIGGGFGGKAGIGIEPLVACLSRKAGGRPVKLQATREEEFSLLPCRSALTYHIKTGVRKDGKIVAQKMTMYWDSGAYADYAVNVTRASGYSCTGPYEIPNAWADAYTIYTNKPYGTAYRGFGHVEFSWGLERQMDLAARAIGMDPLEFRRLNTLKPGSTTLTGEIITEHTGNVTKCIEEAARAISYGTLTKEEEARQKKTGWKIGKSVAGLHKAPAMPPFTGSAVYIKMNEDASVIATVSLTDMGQGTYTSIAQLIAERLRIPFEKVKVAVECDTDRDPYDWQTVASKGLLIAGNAAILAANDLLAKAYDMAAQVLRAQLCDLDHDSKGVFLRHHDAKRVNFTEMAAGYAYPDGNGIGGPLVGVGRYIAQGLSHLDKATGQGNPALDWTYGAHGLVVEVNEETGEYNIIKVSSVFDVGKTINPGEVRGQAVGGMIQGLGTACCEGYIYDDKGRLMNPSFTDNKIFTAMDLPEVIESAVVETPQLDGPYGARGIGEHSMIGVCAALGNAIQQATGAELVHMPIRFEDVWRAVNNKKGIDAWIIKKPAR